MYVPVLPWAWFFLSANNFNRKKDYLPKKKVEMAVLYDPRIIVPDLGTIKLSPVVFNFDCIFSLPKAFQMSNTWVQPPIQLNENICVESSDPGISKVFPVLTAGFENDLFHRYIHGAPGRISDLSKVTLNGFQWNHS